MKRHWRGILYICLFFSTFMVETYYSGSLSFYYTHTLGLTIRSQAVAWSIFVAISLVLGIVIGIVEDRFVSRGTGRRIPFIRVCGPVLGIAFALAFNVVPFGFSNQGLLAGYLISLFVLFTSESFVTNALLAVPSEEIRDDKKRTSTYIVIGIISGVALLLYILVSHLQESGSDAPLRFQSIMALVGGLGAVILFTGSFFLPHSYVLDLETVRQSKPVRSFFECLKNRTFLIGEIYLTAVVCTTTVSLLGLYYYFQEVVEPGLITYVGFPAGIVSVWLFYAKTKDRLSKRLLYGLPTLTAALFLLITVLLGKSSAGPFFGFFAGGIGAFIQYTFNNVIIVESVDDDEKRTGMRKEAQYIQLDYIFDSIGSLCQSLYLIIILAFGFVEGAAEGSQSLTAQWGIILATFGFPAVLLIIGTIAMLFFYPEHSKKEKEYEMEKEHETVCQL